MTIRDKRDQFEFQLRKLQLQEWEILDAISALRDLCPHIEKYDANFGQGMLYDWRCADCDGSWDYLRK